jgi:Flp pilus assembly protein TadD
MSATLVLQPCAAKRNKRKSAKKGADAGITAATALINAGVSLGKEGRMAEAIASLQRATAAAPEFAEAYYNLGIGLDRAGLKEEAVVSFRTAMDCPGRAGAGPNYVAFGFNKTWCTWHSVLKIGMPRTSPFLLSAFCFL